MNDLVASTLDRSQGQDRPGTGQAPLPGLVLVFSGRQPRLSAIPLPDGELVLGRGEHGEVQLQDACMSRQHAMVRFDEQGFAVQDLGSRNGTSVDGKTAPAHVWMQATRLVRMGDSLFLPMADVRPFLRAEVLKTQDGRLLGPLSQRTFQAIGRAAKFGSTLHVAGESGVGKESAAHAFHSLGPCAGGPFIAVNCAAIPEGIAERLLFGARRGAYSGAAGDSEGYVQAADGGTLFLDEVADLDASVQGKLLRVLETKEVLALGATRARPVSLRICSATHKDLRAQVAEGRLREDLYFRIGRPEVVIPPLRERPEEIPWLIEAALQQVSTDVWPHASLVEACLLRPWPGNIRELLIEIRAAAQEALASADQKGQTGQKVELAHLGARAGMGFAPEPQSAPPMLEPQPAPTPAPAPDPAPPVPSGPPDDLKAREARPWLEAALRQTGGNVSSAARLLGMHRTQLRRLLAHHGIDARIFPRVPT